MSSNWKTEEEATKCWCPQVRCIIGTTPDEKGNTESVSPASFNVIVCPDPQPALYVGRCHASGCAMWVWSGDEKWDADKTDVLHLGGCGLRRLP